MNLCGRGDKDMLHRRRAPGDRAVSGAASTRRFARARGRGPRAALVTSSRPAIPIRRPRSRSCDGAAGGGRRRHRARHAVLRSDGRRPGDPGAPAQRALKAGADAGQDARRWCATSAPATPTTPIVLMGYYNPIYATASSASCADAEAAGVDGLIVVDLPPEEDDELCLPAQRGRARLHPPRHADHRRPARCPPCSRTPRGFVYYVSITGITGAATPDAPRSQHAVPRIQRAHASCRSPSASASTTPEQARRDRARRRRRRGRHRRWSTASRARRQAPGAAAAARPGRGAFAAGPGAARWRLRRHGRAGMSWFDRRSCRPEDPARSDARKREVPENLWIKCPACERMLFHRDLEAQPQRLPELRLPPCGSARGRALRRLLDRRQLARIEIGPRCCRSTR